MSDNYDGPAMAQKIIRLQYQLKQMKVECNKWEKLAKSWMDDCDKLRDKYEPMVLVESEAELVK